MTKSKHTHIMNLQVIYDDERQKVWMERLRKVITATQADLDKELPSFIALEEDYLKWKLKIDNLKRAISQDKEELRMFEHAEKFPIGVIKKPRLANEYTKEPVQQQVITKKYKQEFTPLPNIKWSKILPPVFKEIRRFVTNNELRDYLLAHNIMENTTKTKSRLITTLSDASHYKHLWKRHNNKVGLLEWFDENGVPKAEYLKNFIQTKSA